VQTRLFAPLPIDVARVSPLPFTTPYAAPPPSPDCESTSLRSDIGMGGEGGVTMGADGES
jgi:hypothetical protein